MVLIFDTDHTNKKQVNLGITSFINCLWLVVVVVVVVVLLAATAQNRCTALVWSCYAPSRGFNNRSTEESNNDNTSTNTKRLSQAERGDGVMEEVGNYSNETQGCGASNCNDNNMTRSGSNGPENHNIEPFCLKSNVKKTVVKENQSQSRAEKRKVSWPDAHGKDIAHVREFEPSESEDEELEGVRNSCVCVIQ